MIESTIMKKMIYVRVASLLFIVGFLFSCSSSLDEEAIVEKCLPQLISFDISASKNKDLIESVKGTVVNDTTIEVWIPYLLTSKELFVDINAVGDVMVGDERYDTRKAYNFSSPVSLTINSSDIIKRYEVHVHTFTGLPVLWIDTENREEIVSKDYYLNATMTLVEDIVPKGQNPVIQGDLQIKGRGNSTWAQPKKPYRLKFTEKVSLLSESKDKSWVLLANYLDHTMLRNATAFYIGSISNLDYTPKSHFVELILNGQYNGTYQLTEKIKEGKNRVNVGDDGFVLEVDNKPNAGEICFTTPNLPNPVRIHEPDVSESDENYKYIENYVNEAERALFSENYLDSEKGYQRYIDIESFAEWYVICELCENSTNLANWYMHLVSVRTLDLA